MEIWTATRNTRLASALGAMGVPIRLESIVDERSGRAETTFYLGITDSTGLMNTKGIKDRYEDGSLEREEPHHPVLDGMRAMYNWSMILDAVNKGRFIRLAKVSGADRSVYVASDSGFPGVSGHANVLRTGDVKLVAALAVVGVPILWVDGERGRRKFTLPCVGYALGEKKGVDAGVIMRDFRAGAMTDFEHPFLYAMYAQRAKERLLDAMRNDEKMILIRKPRSFRAAFVNESASDAKLDKMRNFFNRE